MSAPHRTLGRALTRLILALSLPIAVSAQSPGESDRAAPAGEPRLRVFLDCHTSGCDRNFFVTAMPFALWTQVPADADVHLLITGLTTGAGGIEYTVAFLGRGAFAARQDTLRTTVPPNSTDDIRRRTLASTVQLGLVPYALRVSGVAPFTLVYAPPDGAAHGTSVIRDPWDFWVYRARVNGSGSAESLNSSYVVSGSVNASRVTEDLKVSFNAYQEYRANTFVFSDGTDATYILRSADVSARLVHSVSEHWSLGSRVTGGLSEFRNQDAYGGVDLSAEYNVFPWRDATSRQLIALVALGGRYYDYGEITIFDRLTELRPVARAIIAGESRQQWGSVDGALRYTQFLHDAHTYNLSFNGRAQVRLTRGLALELRGDAAKVNDQLYLRRGVASDDEVLTRQRALATAYRIGGSVGLSFTFGSLYNTIVNPRLDELGT
jgi:hypothetical protein